MGLLDGIGRAVVEQYLRDQLDDLHKWIVYALGKRDYRQMNTQELAILLANAVRNTLEHGSPPD